MPRPGPVGTVITPSSLSSADVLHSNRISLLNPLNSWNGPALGMADTKCIIYRYPSPEPEICGTHASPASSAILDGKFLTGVFTEENNVAEFCENYEAQVRQVKAKQEAA